MKRMKRILAIMLTLALVVTGLTISVSAQKPTSIKLNAQENIKMYKNQERQFTYRISPNSVDEDDEVDWSSSNYDVADVDADGYVTIKGIGVATITVKTTNNKKDSVTITVEGVDENGTLIKFDEDPNSADTTASSSSAAATSTTTTANPPVTGGSGELSLSKLETEVAAGNMTLRGYSNVTVESLSAIGAKNPGNLKFDTLSDKSVEGRITLNPASYTDGKYTGDIKLTVQTNETATKAVKAVFNKFFSNNVKVIRCEQQSFGASVTIAAKVGDIDTSDLYFYTYDTTTNKYEALTVQNVSLDKSGYLHFTTSTGGYIIVSEGALAKK